MCTRCCCCCCCGAAGHRARGCATANPHSVDGVWRRGARAVEHTSTVTHSQRLRASAPSMSEPTRSAREVQLNGCELAASVLAGRVSRVQQPPNEGSRQLQIQQVMDLGPLLHATVPHSDNTVTPRPIGPQGPTGHVVTTLLGPDTPLDASAH